MIYDTGNNMTFPEINFFPKTFAVLLTVIFICSTLPSSIGTEAFQTSTQIIHSLQTGPYSIITDETGEIPVVEDFGYLQIPGKPTLPSKIFSIALPSGATINSISFEYPEIIKLPGFYAVPPVSLPRVIGEENPQVYQQELNTYHTNYNEVYFNTDQYPIENTEFLQTSFYREYNLVDIRFTPFTYYPRVKELTYYPEVTIIIDYIPASTNIIPMNVNKDTYTRQLAEKIIANYDQTSEWYKPTLSRSSHDYVIITIDTLVNHIDALVDWEGNKGHDVNVVTTSWINSNYNGYDLQEKIRNFLRDKYPTDEWGITDVCLIGHYDDVPMRRTAQSTGYGNPETDFYYSELSLPDDQSWDSDGDHQYGENSDPIDFYSEINVGRIPWSDPQIVEDICSKTVAYEQNNDPSFKKNILLLGAYFWSDTDNAVLMETKIDQPWMADWTITRMYEQPYSTYPSDFNLDYDTVKNVWSGGKYAFVNWAGHGSPTSCHVMYSKGSAFVDTNTCIHLNDNYPAIIFADACSNSDTDYLNIGQAMLKQGGVGFLGSTKVAYGKPAWNNPYSGSSQSLDYFFTTCVTSGNFTQGQAHQWSLVEMYINNLWYYNKYETFEWGALWGNPNVQMGIINKAPDAPMQPSGPTNGVNLVTYTYSTSTHDPEVEDLYYQFDWGDGNLSEWYGPYASGQSMEASYSWEYAGVYDITVRAKDEIGSYGLWSEPLSVIIAGGPIIDVGDIRGGLFKINTIIWNRGEEEATDVNYQITLDGGIIFIGRESTGVITSIPGGGFVEVSSGIIMGFGTIQVTVFAEIPRCSDSREKGGATILFFVYINPGGG